MNVSDVLMIVPKFIGGPGSTGFFVFALAIGGLVAWRRPRWRLTAAAAAAALAVGYFVLALPVTAVAIINALPLLSAPEAKKLSRIQTLIVFDGDNRSGRRQQTSHVLDHSTPGEVHLLGSEALLTDLHAMVRPSIPVHFDRSPWTTAAQIEIVRDIAARAPPMTIGIIASRIQMPRISAILNRTDIAVILVPSPLDREPESSHAMLMPSRVALAASRDALYEHAALVYYRWRGRL